MKFIAPAGTTIRVRDLARGLARGVHTTSAAGTLVELLAAASGHTRAWPMSSGRAAMTMILRAMKSISLDPGRDEVVIPAYTCYSVPAAIERAGLRPHLCDIDPATLAMCPHALSRLDFSRVLAIISSNLYGIPNPLPAYESIARSHGVMMLDDAAQALGAQIGRRPVGAFGDAGLYSFDKGKIICTIQGGAIVAGDTALAAAIDVQYERLAACPAAESALNAAKLVIYSACLHPALYALIRRLPFLGLGRTDYHTRSPETRLGSLQTGMATQLIARQEALNSVRRTNAARLVEALHDVAGLILPVIGDDARPVYARFPVRVRDAGQRSRLVGALESAGIGATVSYPSALPDVPEVRALSRPPRANFPGARELARQIVTLPTHGYCPPDLAWRIRRVVQRCRLSPASVA